MKETIKQSKAKYEKVAKNIPATFPIDGHTGKSAHAQSNIELEEDDQARVET